MIIEVDITKYNINYELQYVQFMVGLLRPYIEFECFDTEEKTTNLAGESVPKKGLKIFRKKEGSDPELIDENDFIQFIQVDFLNLCEEAKKKCNDELTKEKKGKREFEGKSKSYGPGGGTTIPQDMQRKNYDSKIEYYRNINVSMTGFTTSQDEILLDGSSSVVPPQFSKNFALKQHFLKSNIDKLEQISKVCFERISLIEDVLLFLKNVKDHYRKL